MQAHDQGQIAHCNTPLWQALAAMRIEPEGAALSFAAKLAREQGWTRSHADAVVEEYRRFLYLAATCRHVVAPSRMVDKAWHLHLTYSRHYWGVLCAELLQRPLHHDPSLGGAADQARDRDRYARTLALYTATFGAPRSDIWPVPTTTARRQPPVAPLAAAVAGSLLLAACAAVGSEGGGALGLVLTVLVIAVIVVAAVKALSGLGNGRRGGRKGGDGGTHAGDSGDGDRDSDDGVSDHGSSDGGDGGSSCGGGCGGGD